MPFTQEKTVIERLDTLAWRIFPKGGSNVTFRSGDTVRKTAEFVKTRGTTLWRDLRPSQLCARANMTEQDVSGNASEAALGQPG